MTDGNENQGPALSDSWALGLPIFACPAWRGVVYPAKAPRAEWLFHYARRFRVVEGNSTFYGLPSEEIVAGWIEKTYAGFGFSFKFPQTISHKLLLEDAEAETAAFLNLLRPLHDADRLASTMLQLPPFFGPDRLPGLWRYLDALPRELAVAVEVRHPAFFEGGSAEETLDRELTDRGVERVLLDGRCLFSERASTEAERATQGRKPKLPVKIAPLTERPIVRLICRDRLEDTEPWLVEWAGHLAHWIERGRRPILFLHAPDDAVEPGHAARLLELLQERGVAAPVLPAPSANEFAASDERQGTLF